mgnify:CR=1 FL=1
MNMKKFINLLLLFSSFQTIAQKNNIDWWVTSALESNVGLNAIAQWALKQNNPMPQGLGTGALYTNNFESPLEVKNGQLLYSTLPWNFSL